MMEVLIALADQATWPDAEAAERYRRLKELCAEIEKVKSRHREDLAESAANLLQKLQRDDPKACKGCSPASRLDLAPA